jgi:hypothetical protein
MDVGINRQRSPIAEWYPPTIRIVEAEDGYIDAAIDRDLSRHNFSAHKRRSGYKPDINRRNAHGGKQRRAILTAEM